MQLLPGFRDFFPEDCARRNYILAHWREVCRRYGFVEYDFVVRVSSRDIWALDFLADKLGDIVAAVNSESEFFQILDKIEREPTEADLRLKMFNTTVNEVQDFIATTTAKIKSNEQSAF